MTLISYCLVKLDTDLRCTPLASLHFLPATAGDERTIEEMQKKYNSSTQERLQQGRAVLRNEVLDDGPLVLGEGADGRVFAALFNTKKAAIVCSMSPNTSPLRFRVNL